MKKILIILLINCFIILTIFKVKANVTTFPLVGKTIIIDSGHGGKDAGASANEIKESLGAYTNHIRDCCLGNLKSYLGYRWSYEKVDKLPPIKYKTNAIPVIQFDKDWKFIKEWKSALEINKTLNIDQSSIGRCCKGKQETSGGYRWKYKTDCE